MTQKMGMDIEEFSDRSSEIGKGINWLCDELYAATEDEVSLEDVNDLLVAGEKKIALFDKLLSETTGGMHDGLQKKYEDYIEDIVKYSAQLREKYHD